MIYVDRNVLSRLRSILRAPDAAQCVSDSWWLKHLDRPGVRFNPVLCGLEGNVRRTPSASEFSVAIDAAATDLRAFFNSAEVLDYDHERQAATYGILQALAHRRAAEGAFLHGAAPLVASRVRCGQERPIEDVIVAMAADSGLPAVSTPVLAVLSVLYEPHDGTEPRIGRGVVKPRSGYSPEDAYNTAADLQALEWLTIASALTGGDAALLTLDRSLLNFWIALDVDILSLDHVQLRWQITPSRDLVPRLSEEERMALVARLAARDAS
ncbi:MAG: hypothetical protein IT359_10890 [Gemmatimonadaceae bacterium]|nr:hypothetical protein [Gemmatimonadaceae bacterium]